MVSAIEGLHEEGMTKKMTKKHYSAPGLLLTSPSDHRREFVLLRKASRLG